MIPLEKLLDVNHIITHENCPDGVASAMILKKVLPGAKVTFVNYGTSALTDLAPAEGMLFCDITPLRERVQEFVSVGTICLDHHKTQKDVVKAFGELGVFGDETTDQGVCGAVLAHREVFLPLANSVIELPFPLSSVPDQNRVRAQLLGESDIIQEFAALAGIRDTWQRKDPRWVQACEQAEALTFWPEAELIQADVGDWRERMSLGPFLFQRRLKHAAKSADNGYRFTTPKGIRGIVFEGVRATSDATEYLGDSVDLIIGFATHNEGGQPVVIFSTRSHTDFDCAAFCKSLGGGGHTKAAGFTYKMQPWDLHPFYLAEQIVLRHESLSASSWYRQWQLFKSYFNRWRHLNLR